jgi:hypothetical protein
MNKDPDPDSGLITKSVEAEKIQIFCKCIVFILRPPLRAFNLPDPNPETQLNPGPIRIRIRNTVLYTVRYVINVKNQVLVIILCRLAKA